MSRRALTRVSLLAAALAAPACYDPTFIDPVCGPGGACPDGWTCSGDEGAACVLVPAPDGPPGCDPTWGNVLANGDFEGGHTIWDETPAGTPSICRSDELTLHTQGGDWAGCFGRNDNRAQTLTQRVKLPAMTTRVRLAGYRCLVTGEAPDADPYDVMTIQLTDDRDDTAVVADVARWSNQDAGSTCRWDYFQAMADVVAPSPAPRMAVVRIDSTLDNGRVTSFYLDSLAFEAFGCPAP